MRKIEPLSLIVFIIGVVLAITGVTLAIVFGVQHGKDCPTCYCTNVITNDCSAHLFTVRTGLKGQTWNDDLSNSNSKAFIELANITSIQMQASLQASMTAQSNSFVMNAATDNTNNNVIVQVTSFIPADDSVTVIAVASAGIAGPAPSIQQLPPTIDTTMQETLQKDNYTEPVVDNNSMTFCQNPYRNLTQDATNAPPTVPVTCPTVEPLVINTCSTQPAPTECNCQTEGPPSPATSCPICEVCPSPSEPTPCDCPSVSTEVSPTLCPVQVCPSTSEPTSCNCTSVSTESPLVTAVTDCPTPVVIETCPTPPEPPECICPTDAIATSPTSCPIQSCPTQEPTQCSPCPISNEPQTCPTQPAPTAMECNCPTATSLPAVVTDCPTNPPLTSSAPLQTSSLPIASSTNSPVATSTVQPTATVTQAATSTISVISTQAATSPSLDGSTTGTPIVSTTPVPSVATSTVPESTAQSSSVVSTSQTSVANTQTTVTLLVSSTVTQSASSTVTQSTPVGSSTVTQQQSTQQSSSQSSPATTVAASTGTSVVTETTVAQSSTEPYSSTAAPTSCPGYSVYKGDIAIVYEQLSSKVVPSQPTVPPESSTTPEPPLHYIDIELFIASQLMGYGGNPYDLPGGNTRSLLAPYPKTNSYNTIIQGNYAGTPKSVSQLNSTMNQANAITVANPNEFTDPVIADGLMAVQNANDHGNNYGVLVIIGYSAEFVTAALPLATSLRANYHIFAISFDGTQDFSALATDANSSFTLDKPSDAATARDYSTRIGQFAVSQSSECISTTLAIPTTTTKQTTSVQTTTMQPTTTGTFTTTASVTTTEYCPNKYINQDIAIVWEESMSTGDFVVSNNVNLFLQTLIPQIEQNLMDSSDLNWSPITNLSLVEYPIPAAYGTYGSFGTITKSTLPGILDVIQTLGSGAVNSADPNINSGLLTAQTEFAALSSGRKQTIILIANIGTGVGGAIATASDLKTSGITIITVAAVTTPDGTLPLHDLSSGANYEFNLDTTNQGGYTDVSQLIMQALTVISTQCCVNSDCYNPTTPVPSTLGSTPPVPTSTVFTTAKHSTVSTVESTTGISTTALPTTTSCNGHNAFYGDISIIFELTKEDMENGKEDQIQSFITDRLLAYSGYQIDGVTSRILLSPYGSTSTNYYAGNPGQYSLVTGLSSTKTFMSTYNNVCNVLTCTSVAIKDGLDFTATANDHGTRTGAAIIIGYSSTDLVAAQPFAASLKAQGYTVFTVSFDPTQPLDALASDGSVFTRNTVADEMDIAKNIGEMLMALSTVCVPPLTTPIPTTTPTFTTTAPVTTTEYCPNKYINQDIAIVWEESMSTNSYDVSNNVNLFLQTLIPQIEQNLMDSSDLNWSPITNLSLVEYPNPGSYDNTGSFGTITSSTLSGILNFIMAIGTGMRSGVSDINSGLQYAQTAFAALSSGRKQTIILFANIGSGVGAAVDTATALKNNGITILTVAAVTSPGTTIPLGDLSSGTSYQFNLDTTNRAGFAGAATQIVQSLASISTQCCYDTDCTTTTNGPPMF